MLTLDVDAVRAFITISDLKSFSRAAEELGTTQGALSVKLKRLEEKLGQRLIERTPRQVRLSLKGELFIEPARDFLKAHERAIASLSTVSRRFTLGIAHDVMGPEMPSLLSKLKAIDPTLLIEVRFDSTRELLEASDNGLLDVVIARSEDNRQSGTLLCAEDFGWYAAPSFEHDVNEPLPLASLSPSCKERAPAKHALEQASLPWIEVFIGGGAPAVIAAISAGFAVGVFARRLAPVGLIDVGAKYGLPELPAASIAVYSSLSDSRTREVLKAIVSEFNQRRQ
ncbi:LysR family transcriptional regulator [Rouxiella sp. Mn2063]|uniref:LysR family transcriptional regulator n=1 Tax=Rouxiella sp. Mn2063 TaxID=3395262 RepID=UPI003BBE7F7E